MHTAMEQSKRHRLVLRTTHTDPSLEPAAPSSLVVQGPLLLQGWSPREGKGPHLWAHTLQRDDYNLLPRQGLCHFLSLLFRAPLV